MSRPGEAFEGAQGGGASGPYPSERNRPDKQAGVRFKTGIEVDEKGFKKIAAESDAVIIATGKGESGTGSWGLPMHPKGIEADPETYQVRASHVFVVGSALKPSKMAIRALGQGKEAAFSVDQFLQGKKVSGEPFMFNSRFGKLDPAEYAEYLKESVPGERIEPESISGGLTREQVMEEAARCLHCDCRELENCRLRIYSDEYGADQRKIQIRGTPPVHQGNQHDAVIYEAFQMHQMRDLCKDHGKIRGGLRPYIYWQGI